MSMGTVHRYMGQYLQWVYPAGLLVITQHWGQCQDGDECRWDGSSEDDGKARVRAVMAEMARAMTTTIVMQHSCHIILVVITVSARWGQRAKARVRGEWRWAEMVTVTVTMTMVIAAQHSCHIIVIVITVSARARQRAKARVRGEQWQAETATATVMWSTLKSSYILLRLDGQYSWRDQCPSKLSGQGMKQGASLGSEAMSFQWVKGTRDESQVMLIFHRLRMLVHLQEDKYLTNKRRSTDQAVQD